MPSDTKVATLNGKADCTGEWLDRSIWRNDLSKSELEDSTGPEGLTEAVEKRRPGSGRSLWRLLCRNWCVSEVGSGLCERAIDTGGEVVRGGVIGKVRYSKRTEEGEERKG
jgi:hypothetical protein